jgi:hypothetical protein
VAEESRTQFWGTIFGLLRRKRVVIPALLVGLTLGAVAYSGTPTSYVSTSTMVLTTTEYGGTESQDPAKPNDLSNPLLNFNDSLKTTSAILLQLMGTKSVTDQLGAVGPTSLIVNDGRTNPDLLGLNGPFVYVVAKSTSASEAGRLVKDAQALMRKKLRDWQNEVKAPQKTYVSLVDVVPPTSPTPDNGQGKKLALLAFLFGFMLCLGIAYFGHQFRARRAARAAALPVVDETPQGDEPGDEPIRHPYPAAVLVPDEDETDADEAVEDDELGDDDEDDHDGGDGSGDDDDDDDDDDGPAVVSATLTKVGPAHVASTPLTKVNLAVVRAPVKLKVRSRHR